MKNIISDNLYIQKKSPSYAYNLRLKRQCMKQIKFKNMYNIYTPQIYEYGYHDGLFYFNMEYINCKTLVEHFNSITINEINDCIYQLFCNIYYRNKYDNTNSKNIFLKKIYFLEEQLKQYDYLNEPFNILRAYDWSCVEQTPCHGDLTLENILVTADKKIYLIDFLDSFYNSWMIDFAKLFQDLELRWSFRNIKLDMNTEFKLLVGLELLIEKILNLNDGINYLKTIYHILLLNIIRIYPYTSDNKTLTFLNNSIYYLLSKHKGGVY